ncbi:MAG: helix-turn-helix domain-containing protein [Nakamurella sp.]
MVDDQDATIGRAFAAVLKEAESTNRHTDGTAMIGALLAQIDILLRRAGETTQLSAAAAAVAAAEEIMARNHTERVQISELAARVGVAASTLRAYFVAELGVSPRDRLRQLRLQHATVLLSASDLTIEAIATRCGYHSASHLSRHLRAATGLSPGQLRTADADRQLS